MNPALRRSAAHVFVDSLEAPELRDDDAHHLGRVLRIRPTDVVTVADGSGRWAEARFDAGALTLAGVIHRDEPAMDVTAGTCPLTIACAIPKGDRADWVVQKLAEVGLDRVLLVETARTVVRWDARKRAAQVERWRRIAREAAMQSRRLSIPDVDAVTWDDVLALPRLALAQPGGRDAWAALAPAAAGPTLSSIAVGPEGGFTDHELAGCPDRVSLGDTVLRVETAAVVAGALLTAGGRRRS